MKFAIGRTSMRGQIAVEPPAPGAVMAEGGKTWLLDVADLDELVQLIDTLEEPLILSRRQGPAGLTAIEIYDDMREEDL